MVSILPPSLHSFTLDDFESLSNLANERPSPSPASSQGPNSKKKAGPRRPPDVDPLMLAAASAAGPE